MSQHPGEHVEVWQQPDAMWRWQWLPRQDEREKVPSVVSAKAFPDPQSAKETASGAYPELPVVVVDKTPEEKRRSRRALGLLLLAGFLTALLWHRRPRQERPVAIRLERPGSGRRRRTGRMREVVLLQIGPWTLTRE